MMENIEDFVRFLKKNQYNLIKQFTKLPDDLTEDTYLHSDICSSRDRFSNIKTSDNNMIDLSTGYFNGSYILGNKYIATQQPVLKYIDHFWTMIIETGSKIIVNLTGSNVYLGYYTKFNIVKQDYYEDTLLDIKKLLINNEQQVFYICFKRWIDHSIPEPDELEKLLLTLSICKINGPITIHCKAGVGRTGTLILIHHILEELKQNKYCDPIDIVKEMRKCRSGMIQGCEQFNFAINYILKKVKVKQVGRKNLTSSSDSSCGRQFLKNSMSLTGSLDNLHI